MDFAFADMVGGADDPFLLHALHQPGGAVVTDLKVLNLFGKLRLGLKFLLTFPIDTGPNPQGVRRLQHAKCPKNRHTVSRHTSRLDIQIGQTHAGDQKAVEISLSWIWSPCRS